MMDLKGTAMSKSKEPLSRKERLNRNILIGCAVLGGVLGVSLAIFEPDPAENFSIFSKAPIPAIAAIIFAVIWGIIVPVISFFWHRTVDEQEAHAYREGAYYAFYLYVFGAPLWWILWRGGLLPEPDGIAIYYATLLTCGGVWLWKKYR